jgi:hypothetical protein
MKYRKYSVSTKLEVIDYAKSTSINAAAVRHSINRKRIREWISQENDLRSLPRTACRQPGGGRKPSSVELEEMLFARVLQERLEKKRVTRSMIVEWATLLRDEQETDLQLSKGWLEGFLERHNFVL